MLDLERMAEWLAGVLKTHCAHMRDSYSYPPLVLRVLTLRQSVDITTDLLVIALPIAILPSL
jgi:hypothetical protein